MNSGFRKDYLTCDNYACIATERLCRNCHQHGHGSNECLYPRNTGKQCHSCGGFGHVQTNCPSGGLENEPGNGVPAAIKCFRCGGLYHYYWDHQEDHVPLSVIFGMVQAALDAQPTATASEKNLSAPNVSKRLKKLAVAQKLRPPPSFLYRTLDPIRWRAVLQACNLLKEHRPLIHHLEHGFSYNSSISIPSSLIHSNRNSATDYPDLVMELIQKERDLGRYLGPFPIDQIESLLGRPFISHPIGLTDKDNGTKRLIEDLSYPSTPQHASVNSLSSDNGISVNWGGFQDAVELVVTAPPGSQGATVDWKDAFRMLGVRPDEWWMGIVQFLSYAWIDRCCKFGARSSSFNFELVAAAFAAIFHRVFVLGKLIYWVDDNLIRRIPLNTNPLRSPNSPWSYPFSIQDVLDLGSALNAVFSPEKVCDFSFITKYIGYMWHWDTKEVKLPEDKRISAYDLVSSILSSPFLSLAEIQTLTGTLGHCAMVLPLGPKFLRNLYDLQTRMKNSHRIRPKTRWPLDQPQIRDLQWWARTLAKPNVGMKLCPHPHPTPSFSLFSDASTSGIGIIINHEFDLFQLVDDWRSSGEHPRDIAWAEFIAVEIAISCILSSYNLHDTHLLLHMDSTAVLGAWSKHRSRNSEQNEVLGRIISLLVSRSCFLSLEYVPSAENPADAPSRGYYPPGYSRRTFKGLPKKLKGLVFRL